METQTSTLPAIFAALGDSTRFAILNHLLQNGEQPAGALHALADISAPAFSRHLKVLHAAGLVTRRVDKQRRIYKAHPATLSAINEWAASYQSHWITGLDRLLAGIDDTPQRT